MWETIIIQPFVNVLLLINSLVQNFGISIILFTILMRLLTHPLTASSFKSNKGLQELQKDPRYKKMQEKYKNDKEKLAQEQMKLYKEYNINPLGSCLPTLIQLPLILGIYQSVIRAMAATPFELQRLAELIYPNLIDAARLLPLENRFLWMDLGQPERIQIFGIGIPLLAIIVVITTYLQSKLIQPPSTGNDQTAMMTKSMNLYMPVLMGWMAYSLASGLALYFLTSNVFGIFQYMALGRADWSNIIPFLKKKDGSESETKTPEVIEVEVEDIPEPEVKRKTSPSAANDRKLPKRKRPKRKK
jgi:YidC/Oxa1 family membrane protein insertase